ncbi:MAG: non-ribosomal peptide synthetase, partial [Pseudonocardiaceae bacterium]
LSAPTPLPYDRLPTQAHTSRSSDRVSLDRAVPESERLYEFARRHHLTVSAVVQGAWALLLSRYSGERDVCFGVTMSGRPAELVGVDQMTGIFINTLPMRVEVSRQTGVVQWLQELQTTQAQSRRFEHLSLMQLQAWSDVPGGVRLFDSIVVFENYPINDEAAAAHDLRVRELQAVETTNYPLLVAVTPGRRLSLELGYDPALFDLATVEALTARLARVLDLLIENPTLPVGRIDIITDDERACLLTTWNDTDRAVEPATLPALLQAQVVRTPNAVAVVCGSDELSYRQLDERANRLAWLLIERGVGPEQFVGLALPRSVELVVALVAVWKAGAGYLPIDPTYPVERIEFMLTDARPALVLTLTEVAVGLPGLADVGVLVLDDPGTVAAVAVMADRAPTDAERGALSLEHPAYVIYTSGSTGQPKGVVVSHAGVSSLAVSQIEWLGVSASSRVLQFASPSFDASFWELCMSLLSGAALVVAPAEQLLFGAPLAALAGDQGVTHATLPSSVLAALPAGERLPPAMTLVVAGEACPRELVVAWSPGRRMINAYGPTETTVCAT